MTTVLNHDVAGMCRRINRFIVEVQKSASAGVADMAPFDQERLDTYLLAIRVYGEHVLSQPQLDLPKTHPRAIELGSNPVLEEMVNEAVRDIVYLMELGRDELVSSQSASRPSGYTTFDHKRTTSILDKCKSLLEGYVKVAQPLDLPEGAPEVAAS